MTWVLVLLLWSSDGSDYRETPEYWFNSLPACEAQKAVMAAHYAGHPTVELYCEDGKYYRKPHA